MKKLFTTAALLFLTQASFANHAFCPNTFGFLGYYLKEVKFISHTGQPQTAECKYERGKVITLNNVRPDDHTYTAYDSVLRHEVKINSAWGVLEDHGAVEKRLCDVNTVYHIQMRQFYCRMTMIK